MMLFLRKNRRWIMGGGAVILILAGLGWQLYSGGEGPVKASCLDGGGTWKDGACTFH